jgi:hypothetical protein
MEQKEYDADIRRLVVARLRNMPSHVRLSIGSGGDFDREQLISNVEGGTELGNKVVEIQMNYLHSLKDMYYPR